jgi:tetratricopeptide (TPR) repeat protein
VRENIVLGLGGVLALAALVVLAVDPPSGAAIAATTPYPTYTPPDQSAVVARVARRDPRELALRAELRVHPSRVELAVELAHDDLQRARSLSDPRYLGRAQATLARWWGQVSPPPDVLLLRATIRQSLHDFTTARADLEQLIARRPADGQAHLTLAVVATVTGDYAAARRECAIVATLAAPIIAMTCNAQIDGVTGKVTTGRASLEGALADPQLDPTLRDWAISAVAELAIITGDYAAATKYFQEAVVLDPADAYARAGLADVLMWSGKPAEASALLAGYEAIDNLLVRRAIAEHATHGKDEAKLVRAMRDRITAAAERGDRIHVREEARFTLEVDGDARHALALALENWAVQKELADARLVAEAAKAAGDLAAAAPVAAWMRTNHVEDVQTKAALGFGEARARTASEL